MPPSGGARRPGWASPMCLPAAASWDCRARPGRIPRAQEKGRTGTCQSAGPSAVRTDTSTTAVTCVGLPVCEHAAMAGWVRRWQQRVRAAEDLRIADDVEAGRLSEAFPRRAAAPDGTLVRFALRWSGEVSFSGLPDALAPLGLLVDTVWSMGAWVAYRDGWTIWASADCYRRSKFRYSSHLSALRCQGRPAGRSRAR